LEGALPLPSQTYESNKHPMLTGFCLNSMLQWLDSNILYFKCTPIPLLQPLGAIGTPLIGTCPMIIIATLILGMTAFQSGPQDTVNKIDITNYISNEKIDMLSDQLANDPENYLHYLHRGIQFCEMEDWDRAEKDFIKAKIFNPKVIEIYGYLAFIYLKGEKENLKACRDEIDAGLKLEPNNIELISARALLYAKEKKPEKALEDANKVIEKKNGKKESLGDRGIIYYLLGRYEDAMADFRREIEVEPSAQSGFFHMYLVHQQKLIELKMKNKKKEMEDLDKCFKNSSDRINDARRKMKEGKFQEALSRNDQAIAFYPEMFFPYYQKAVLLLELRKYEEALGALDKSIRLQPDFPDAYYGKAFAKLKQGKYGEAIDPATTAIQKTKDYVPAYYLRGMAYDFLDKNKEALEDYQTTYRLDRNTLDIQKNIGRIYFKLGNYAEAVNYFTRAIQLDPKGDFGGIYFLRAKVYEKMGDKQRQDSDLKKAREFAKEREPN